MSEVVIRKSEFDAVIFDLDGVITKSADVHEASWAKLFNGYLRERADGGGDPFEPFTTADYGRYVDGKPRYNGVQSFLQSRRIDLPWGDPSDPPDRETVCGLGNRKNVEFLRIVEEDGVEPYSSSVQFISDLHRAGIKTALFSSSRNAGPVLEAAGLGDLFSVRIDGKVAKELGLAGKPDPVSLHEATNRLGATPDRTAVVEDALSGVEAGRRGNYALVIGVDRIDQAAELARHGADVVVSDLAEVGVASDVTGEASMADLPSALATNAGLPADLAETQVAVFLDYDGTLTPIVEHPDMASLAPETRTVLANLAEVTPVAIISGRDVVDVMEKVGVSGLYYAGSHGFDIRTPSGEPVGDKDMAQFDTFLPTLDDVEAELRSELGDVPGSNVERKRFAIAVHYRQVPEQYHATVADAVDRIAPGYPTLRVASGKMIFEFRPNIEWDKGKAVDWLLTEMDLDHPGVIPLYIGDDVTDEHAYRALRNRGVSIVVRMEERTSAADYALDDTDEVRIFLDRLRVLIEGADK
jgi:trehalose 6-phosphate phosphatase